MLDSEANSLAGWARQSFTLIEEACQVQFYYYFGSKVRMIVFLVS
jgi:hypothetical protein